MSRFFGIIIRMYAEVNAPHHESHLHAYYQDEVAIYSLDPIELIAGSLPKRQARFVEAWSEMHQAELRQIGIYYRLVKSRFRLNRSSKKRMKHRIYRVIAFDIVAPYVLRVRFDDDTEQMIDFQTVLAGELYRPLRDLDLFNEVGIDPEVQTLVWPNGADFDPATLHDWPQHVEALIKRARQWELLPA